MKKLLIVDDEPDVCEFAKNFFELRNLKVFTALNGQEALSIVERERPSIVLLDIKMEGMDGIDVLRKLREFDKKIKVFMVTGVEEKDKMKEVEKLGASGYITKPLVLEELEKTVMKVVKKK